MGVLYQLGDVVELLPPFDWDCSPNTSLHNADDFVTEVAALASLELPGTRALVESVFSELHETVPEEAGPIVTTLPEDLRKLWECRAA